MSEELFAGRYRLERRLGVGGMATVQLAFDTRLERNVAHDQPIQRIGQPRSRNETRVDCDGGRQLGDANGRFVHRCPDPLFRCAGQPEAPECVQRRELEQRHRRYADSSR